MEETTEIYIDGTCNFSEYINDGNIPIFVESKNCKNEDDLMLLSLKNSNPDKYLIILYGKLSTELNKEEFLKGARNVIENINFDVFFMSRYLDDSKRVESISENGDNSLVRVFSPHGIEALIVSPSGKEKLTPILKKTHGRGIDFVLNAYCEKINCYSTKKPMISVIVPENNIKRILYRDHTELKNKPEYMGSKSDIFDVFWFIYFIILLICLAFVGVDIDLDELFQNSKIIYNKI